MKYYYNYYISKLSNVPNRGYQNTAVYIS